MKERDDAISPVIAVMLMLVVTIIIAAVVSGFAGGLVGSQTTAPSGSFDVSLTDDSIDLTVRSISEPLPSKDISIVLSKPGQMRKLMPGTSTVPFGFNIVEPPVMDEDGIPIKGIGFHDNENVTNAADVDSTITATAAAHETNSMQWFGSYTLKTGSRMSASYNAFIDVLGVPLPEGFSKPTYTKSEFNGLSEDTWKSVFGETVTKGNGDKENSAVLSVKAGAEITDQSLAEFLVGKSVAETVGGKTKVTDNFWVEAIDKEWHFGQTITYHDGFGGISISPGDSVTVTLVHTPSGQTMFMKTVTVKEA